MGCPLLEIALALELGAVTAGDRRYAPAQVKQVC